MMTDAAEPCVSAGLVSVIIPTLRRHDLVLRALYSVLAQTYRQLEVIVIIDGDDPLTAAALAGVTDERVTTLQNPVSLGAGRARNCAAEAAHGEWIAFLDDDDEWLPEKLQRQLAGRSSAEAVVLSCKSEVRTPKGTYCWPTTLYGSGQPVDEYLFDRRTLFRGDTYIGTTSYLIPLWLFRRAGFGETSDNEDTTLLLRLTKQHGARIVMLPDTLVRLYREEQRESLGASYKWRETLDWLNSMGGLITRRAYSGFCLIQLGSAAARAKDYRGWLQLVFVSFTRGSPTLMQLVPALSFVVFPDALRASVRARLKRRRVPIKASVMEVSASVP